MSKLTFSRMILLRKIPEGGLAQLKEMALSSFSDMKKNTYNPSRGLNVILILKNRIYIIYYFYILKKYTTRSLD
jgi:hypothetical protein